MVHLQTHTGEKLYIYIYKTNVEKASARDVSHDTLEISHGKDTLCVL